MDATAAGGSEGKKETGIFSHLRGEWTSVSGYLAFCPQTRDTCPALPAAERRSRVAEPTGATRALRLRSKAVYAV